MPGKFSGTPLSSIGVGVGGWGGKRQGWVTVWCSFETQEKWEEEWGGKGLKQQVRAGQSLVSMMSTEKGHSTRREHKQYPWTIADSTTWGDRHELFPFVTSGWIECFCSRSSGKRITVKSAAKPQTPNLQTSPLLTIFSNTQTEHVGHNQIPSTQLSSYLTVKVKPELEGGRGVGRGLFAVDRL
jgi:hypothetical protein